MRAARPVTAPGGVPLPGHLPALLTRPLPFLDTHPAHGDLVRVRVRVGPREMYVASGPEPVRRVLTDRTAFDRTGPLYAKVRAFLGNGLASCPHVGHRPLRGTVQPAFRRALLPHHARTTAAETAALTAGWRAGQVADATHQAFRLTTAVAVRTLFSAGPDPRAAEDLRGALDVLLRGIHPRVVPPAADLLPTSARRDYRRPLAAAPRRGGPGPSGAADRAVARPAADAAGGADQRASRLTAAPKTGGRAAASGTTRGPSQGWWRVASRAAVSRR